MIQFIRIVQCLLEAQLNNQSLLLHKDIDDVQSNNMRIAFRKVSEIATTCQVGHTPTAIKFKKATEGAEHIAAVTPATVRIRP